ncbi:MAG: hypothetical protein DHS20C18_12640 [Saprospiraceae bacterium]|nr:MAG: hypothetical protein DHS20C18_12640 [Saprospiraceae bacterium]
MKRYCLFLSFFLATLGLSAQHFELGLTAGATNYLGDLSKNSKGIVLKSTRAYGGLFGRYNFNNLFALRLGANYGQLTGSDDNANDEALKSRNLSFKTNLLEIGLIGELNLPGFQPYNYDQPFSPYLFGGVAFFHYNPKTEYQGEKVALQPLGTEGQGADERPEVYKLWQLSIPMGVGVKYALTDIWTIGLELGARLAFTDYLDDVSGTYYTYPDLLEANGELAAALGNRTGEFQGSEPLIVPTGTQRGDNNSRDWYFMMGLTVSYNFIDNGLIGSRRKIRRSKKGCKTD